MGQNWREFWILIDPTTQNVSNDKPKSEKKICLGIILVDWRFDSVK